MTVGGTAAKDHRDDVVGVAMYLCAAFLFALNGVIAKNALNTGFDAMHLTQLRNAGAMILLVVYIAMRHPDSLGPCDLMRSSRPITRNSVSGRGINTSGVTRNGSE